jgi:hypothetical protein
VFDYNAFGDHHLVESTVEVPAGASTLGVRFRRGDTGGEATLVIDDADCGTLSVPLVMRMISSVGASVGHDRGSPVSHRYPDEHPFQGALERVDIELLSPKQAEAAELARADERATMARQ